MTSFANCHEVSLTQTDTSVITELKGYICRAIVKRPLSSCEPRITKLRTANHQAECETTSKLRHSNIVTYLGIIQPQATFPGLVIEFCELGTLRTILENKNLVYTMKTVTWWGKQLSGALCYLHEEQQLCHRDLKPENIYVIQKYWLKIGDFGSATKITATRTGTFIGTHRYMSPPKKKNGQDSIDYVRNGLEASFRNDVYSMGLCFWEIIERRLVFSQYTAGNGSFEREDFLFDVWSNDPKATLESPKCQKFIQDCLRICTNYDLDMRPSSREVLTMFVEVDARDPFISKLFVQPRFVQSQRLIRPIGFNRQRNKVYVELHNLWPRKPTIAEFRETITERMNNANGEFESQILSTLFNNFNALSNSDKEAFIKVVPQIVDDAKREIYSFSDASTIHSRLIAVQNITNIKEIFKLLILNDFYCQMSGITSYFTFLKSRKIISISPWSEHLHFGRHLASLEQLYLARYPVTITTKAYFSSLSKEELLLLDKATNIFFTEDLSKVKVFEGNWITRNGKDYFLRTMPSNEPDDEFNETKEISICIDDVIKSVHKTLRNIATAAKVMIDGYAQGFGVPHSPIFPIPGYLFQHRNPPRHSCICPNRCPVQLIDPFCRIKEQLDSKIVAHEMRIALCSATPRIYFVCFELYFLLLHFIYEAHHGSILDFSRSIENKLIFDQEYLIFINSKNKTGTDSPFLILLDLPRNYSANEKIPCLDSDLNINYLNIHSVELLSNFTFINHKFEAQVMDADGKSLSDLFRLSDKMAWRLHEMPN